MATIQDAIKALEEGKVCYCYNKSYYATIEPLGKSYYLKTCKDGKFQSGVSSEPFCFDKEEILSEWFIMDPETLNLKIIDTTNNQITVTSSD